MAFGFPAYHTQTYVTSVENAEDAATMAKQALYILEWPIKVEKETSLHTTAYVNFNIRSFGEKLTIDVSTEAPYTLTITSKCMLPTQCFDWGRNKKNVTRFISELDNVKT